MMSYASYCHATHINLNKSLVVLSLLTRLLNLSRFSLVIERERPLAVLGKASVANNIFSNVLKTNTSEIHLCDIKQIE